MKCSALTRKRQHPIPAQAHARAAGVKRTQSACRSQNRMPMQKALMEHLLLGRIA